MRATRAMVGLDLLQPAAIGGRGGRNLNLKFRGRSLLPVTHFMGHPIIDRSTMSHQIRPTGREKLFPASELIVSKTDLRGRMTYVNQLFCEMAGYGEAQLIGQPHSLIRHPDMPRSVFKLLWDTIEDRREIFAYVKNMARDGDHYWVFAHVTPSYDLSGNIAGYHSNRRAPSPDLIKHTIAPLYADVLAIEQRHVNGKDAVAAGYQALTDFVASQKVSYDELMFSLKSAA
jgi:PAS domain S-box-containing protein